MPNDGKIPNKNLYYANHPKTKITIYKFKAFNNKSEDNHSK